MAETPASAVPGLDLDTAPSSTAAQLKATTEATQATLSSTAVSAAVTVDPELEEIKKKVREMEAEAKKLADMQKEVEMAFEQSSSTGPGMPMSAPAMHQPATPSVMFPSLEEKIEADARSIYVGQVEYAATAEEVELHFRGCGALNRVTILCDKFTGHPKGYAYIEFADKESVETAMALDGSYFKGRPIKVMPKRTNKPGISVSERGVMRSRGRGRGRGRGMIRGRGGRGRGRGGYGMGMRGGHNLYASPYQL